ncbi:hypothetical protein IEQ34_015190 [Dendrobium chrysotoxum]|uniref:Uncharacterized protein n=1 Tax=Dendrobium chrysotoxum TaxID=161865 RepID=A0AAV7GHF5_DENCH|nr:hypothetical protein IEQ34_015190 [Dendrobium chrysotoxum]
MIVSIIRIVLLPRTLGQFLGGRSLCLGPVFLDVTNLTFSCILNVTTHWGHGGMGKTTFLQHRKFELKMWVCVFINFDAKKVIGDILNSNLDEMH